MVPKVTAGSMLHPAVADARVSEGVRNWLLPALLVSLVIFQLGYSYGEPSHVIFLPWILHRIGPTLLVNDWFVNTIPHHANSISFMAWLGRLIPLPLAVLILHVLALFLLLWVMGRITDHLFDDSRIPYVALFLFLRWGTDGLGGNGLFAGYLVQHNAALGICLLGFYLALKNKPLAAALACAAATWVHIQLGALTVLVLGLGMLFNWRRTGLRSIVLAGVIYLAAAAPTLLAQWMLYVSASSPLSAREYLYIHGIMRHPHHVIPSTWAGADFYRLLLLVGIAAFAASWRRQPHRTILTWLAIILALCIVGTVFVELVPVKLIIKLQLFRMTVFVKFFAVLYVAHFLLQILEAGGALEKLCALGILAIQNFAVIGMCAALIFALRQKRLWLWGLGLFAAGCVAGVMIVATASLGIPIPMFWHSFAVAPRGVWIGLVTLAALGTIFWRAPRYLPAALLATVVVVRVLIGLPYFGYDHPPADEWYRFCQLVKIQTPRDAIFITPPFLGGFQLFAERAEVANFKCVPLIEKDLLEWKRRMNDLAGATDLRCSGWVQCAGALAGGYVQLREHYFMGLARKYRAQYVVTAQPEHHLNFRQEFRLGDFALYRVPQ